MARIPWVILEQQIWHHLITEKRIYIQTAAHKLVFSLTLNPQVSSHYFLKFHLLLFEINTFLLSLPKPLVYRLRVMGNARLKTVMLKLAY